MTDNLEQARAPLKISWDGRANSVRTFCPFSVGVAFPRKSDLQDGKDGLHAEVLSARMARLGGKGNAVA